MYRQLGLKEPGDDFTLTGSIKGVDIEDIPDTKRFWRHVDIDLEAEYNAWKNEKSVELPKMTILTIQIVYSILSILSSQNLSDIL